MTLDQFRSDKQLVSWCQQLFQTPNWQRLRDALRESHPKNFRAQGQHIGDNAHYKLGRIDGYDEFENNLISAGILNIPADQTISSTFKPD
jgi:hypothetical protein